MDEIIVIETDKHDTKEETGVYRLRVLQNWYYPDGAYHSPDYCGKLYQVVIPSTNPKIHTELEKLQNFALLHPNTQFILKLDIVWQMYNRFLFGKQYPCIFHDSDAGTTMVLNEDCLISNNRILLSANGVLSDVTHQPRLENACVFSNIRKINTKTPRIPHRFYNQVPSRNVSECCFSLYGFLSSWGLAKSKPRWVPTTKNSRIIVSNNFAITFSKKKRLYFFKIVHKYIICDQTNDLFRESNVIREKSRLRGYQNAIQLPVFIPTKTWCCSKPGMEHLLMLWQFGIFCDDFPILNICIYPLLHNEIWTIVLDYLIGTIQDTVESPIIGPFETLDLVKNNIKKIPL
jgi:hypothetical protein